MKVKYEKVYTYIDVDNLEKSLEFYINETGWFYKEEGFGMGTAKLAFSGELEMGIFLVEKQEDTENLSSVHLSFYTSELDLEYTRISNINFLSGAKLVHTDGIFDWPAGRFFTILDPSGNRIAIKDSNGL